MPEITRRRAAGDQQGVPMTDFVATAIRRLIDQPTQANVGAPIESYGARDLCDLGATPGEWWEQQNPGVDYTPGCCDGDVYRGAYACTCWTPVFDVEQLPAAVPTSPAGIQVRGSRCEDCAFRRDSPEQDDEFVVEALNGAADMGVPFWCHQGMRRPTHWQHPDGRTVAGDPADWQPLRVAGLPFQTDGRTALLCAGWAARGRRTAASRG